MNAVARLLTENLPVWSSAVQSKSSAGRGTSSKRNLYGIKKLRELILDLAVRGLLVPQDPSDEPASMLLEKISKEKERLVKEGTIKKQNTLPPINAEEKPFVLPDGWEWERLGNLVYLEMGQSPLSKFYNQNKKGLPFFQGKADFGSQYPTPRYWCTQPHKHAYPNDVLLSVRAPVGPTNIVNIECCIGRGLAALRPLKGTPTNFIDSLLKGFRTNLESFAVGTTFVAVSKSDVENLIITVPPLAEQHRIVAKVDELMALCDKLEQEQETSIQTHENLVETLLEALTNATDSNAFQSAWQCVSAHFDTLFTTQHSIKKLRETILQLAVMGKLVPQDPADEPASVLLEKIAVEKERLIKEGTLKKQKSLPPISDEEKLFALPNNWEWERLGNIGFIGSSFRVHKKDWISSGIPFYRTREIIKLSKDEIINNELFISEELFQAASKRGLVPELNDIMITGIGTIGTPYIVKMEDKFYFKDGSVLIFKNHFQLVPNFLSYYFKSPFWKNKIHQRSMGTTVHTLTINRANETPAPLPPLAEQHRIVAKVDELMALCDKLENALQAAQTTKMQLTDAILEKAL